MGRMKSVMVHSFSQIPQAQIPRSTFNRSHGYKTTFDAGYLVPIYIDEALPGDTFALRLNVFARMATPIFPIMDNLFLDSFFFAVPYRLVWDNFQKMMGEQIDPDDSIDYLLPKMTSTALTGYSVGSLHDYFGIPTGVPDLDHCSLWHRAYNLIFNEWFRDQNLQDSVVVDRDDGPDSPTDYVLLKRGKRHDYFTSALPWPQKGDAVSLPLGDRAYIKGIAKNTTVFGGSATGRESDGTSVSWTDAKTIQGSAGADNTFYVNSHTVDGNKVMDIYADLTDATASTINELRQAFQIQRMLERDARGGTRYTEIIRSHFGVTSPDARLQRPEYLGGGSSRVNVHPVPQTSNTPASGTPQGNLAGFATASINGHGFTKSFTEHCLIIGLVSVRADLTYQQGLNRMFSRRTRYDMYWPSFAHLGEQSVLVKEIRAVGSATPGEDDEVFGYQERYAEYRYKPSQITGKFRSAASGTLDSWHLAQDFSAKPELDDTFIQESPPMARILAVNTEPHFLYDSYIDLKCARPMPVYSVPGLIDHF